MTMIKRTLSTSLAALVAMHAGSAIAQESSLATKMSISFLGINVGKLVNNISVANDTYKVSGAVRSNGVVSVVAKTRASFGSSGSISGTNLKPKTHFVKYTTNKKSGNIKVSYSGGDVKKISATPKIKYKKGSVPVTAAHLRSVLDPVSSLIFPVKASQIGNGRSVCNRTLPIFDGKARINLVMSYKSTQKAKVKGFKGNTFTCAIRYKPVSGIRPARKNIKFMKANRDMQVTLARVGNSNVYALFGFKVRTSKGTASGTAYSFVSK